MIEYNFSNHARDMMIERNISEVWVRKTLSDPDYSEEKEDGTIHYVKAIAEYDGRFLRVIVNPQNMIVITFFFDRKFKRRQDEIKGGSGE